jgi:hypothetical protein
VHIQKGKLTLRIDYKRPIHTKKFTYRQRTVDSSGFQSHSGGFHWISLDSGLIPADSTGFHWIPVIPAGICRASKSTERAQRDKRCVHILDISDFLDIFVQVSLFGSPLWTLKTAPYNVTSNQHHPHFSPQIPAYLIANFLFQKWSLLFWKHA